MKTKYIAATRYLSIMLLILMAACRKSDVAGAAQPSPITGEKRPVGTPSGNITTQNIGTMGGIIGLPDSSIVITIPAGALPAPTDISIQPITNTNIAGLGAAWRLTPHGTIFQKPVSITLSYAAMQDSVNLPQTLSLAYQDSSGIWQCTGGNIIDTAKKTVTFKSTHFSDWSLMPWLMLKPVQATLGDGEELTLQALHYIPYQQCNCDDDLIVPIPEGKPYPVGDPQPLDKKYIGQWNLAGPGTLIPTTTNEAVYKAPASILSFYTATVSLQLKSAHTLILVSNIRLSPNNSFEMRVNNGAWKSYDAAAFRLDAGKAGISFISGVERLSMFFPDAKGTYEWDGVYGNQTTGFNYWPNGTGTAYESNYEKGLGLYDSGGSINITSFGDVGQYITGSFSIQPAGYYSTADGHQIGAYPIEARFRLKRTR